MIKGSIIINKPIEEVYKSVEMQFAKTFKTSPSKLPGATVKSKTQLTKKPIDIVQKMVNVVPQELMSFETENEADIVTTTYYFTDLDEVTRVSLTEQARGVKSKARTVIYGIMSLPVLNMGSKRKVNQRLQGLKAFIEQ